MAVTRSGFLRSCRAGHRNEGEERVAQEESQGCAWGTFGQWADGGWLQK